MATVLRDWSYRYQWLYDAIAEIASLGVGGIDRFHRLPLMGLTIAPETTILDLCCGSGQATKYLVERSRQVTGLDASPLSLKRAQHNVPQATYVEAFAEAMPFADGTFDLVHTSAALHEMYPEQLRQILQEVYRVLKPGGMFALMDFHPPQVPPIWVGIATFFWLFETETAWQFLDVDLPAWLAETGFHIRDRTLHVGGSLQVIQAQKTI